MRKSLLLAGGLAVAGLVALGGSAFTGTGVADTASSNQFIGGTVSNTVSGATLSSIVYGYGPDITHKSIATITLTFSDGAADGATVLLVPAGNLAAGGFTCEDVANTDTAVSTCDYVPVATETGYSGLTGVTVTVGDVATP